MPGGFGYVSPSRDATTQNYAVEGQWLDAPAWNQEPGFEHVVSFGIQREIGSGNNTWLVDVTYNGNFGRLLPVWLGFGMHILPNSYNVLSPLGNALNAQVTNPFYGQVPGGTPTGSPLISLGRLYQLNPMFEEIWQAAGCYCNAATDAPGSPSANLSSWGTSNYHALTAHVEHRFSNGFSLLVNYTFSKLLQDTGSVGNGVSQGVSEQSQPQAGLGLGDIYSVAPSDYTHKLLLTIALICLLVAARLYSEPLRR